VSISVVIPTHNRYDKLRGLLSSLRRHRDELESVIVVDDSHIKQPLDEFSDIGLQHIRVDFGVFISRAKNMGWKAARSEYVYFIDDDNVIGKKTIAPAFNTISGSESIGAVMPAVLYKSRPELVWVYATPFLNSRKDLNLVGRNKPRDPFLENKVLRTDALPNASLVRRRALEDVAGFDERLVVNSSMDFCQRLKARGWRVVSDTGALIFHDVEAPGRFGWWAAHGSVNPERVRYEIRDWFLLMKRIHREENLLNLRLSVKSLRFVLPNFLAYALRGKSRPKLFGSLMIGYVEGLRIAP
jgi:GT2 family glycosyltransferase